MIHNMTLHNQSDQLLQWCQCEALQLGGPQVGGVVPIMMVAGEEIGKEIQVHDQVRS